MTGSNFLCSSAKASGLISFITVPRVKLEGLNLMEMFSYATKTDLNLLYNSVLDRKTSEMTISLIVCTHP